MTPELLEYLCDPYTRKELRLVDAVWKDGSIDSGYLESPDGARYRVSDGIPRFAEAASQRSVSSFGDQWNYFNFDDFKENWLRHTVANTFGSTDAFRDKVIVDAGGGSGAQSSWILEAGARHVLILELSHSVDDVMRRNFATAEFRNFDIVQCSIDNPPLKDGTIRGMVYCHNVIQHTQSVEATARALWRTVAPGGEFVFNCYPKNDLGLLRKGRLALYFVLRALLSRSPFFVRIGYARCMSLLRLVPVLGWFLEKSGFMVRGEVLPGPGYLRRSFRAGTLNTFDCFGAHQYQHLKTEDEMRALIAELQPDKRYVLNIDRYFSRPQPIGIALRLIK